MPEASARTVSLDEVARAVLRERVLLIAVFVAFAVLAGAVGILWPERYEATATLTVEPVAVIDPGSVATVNMETERVVATSTEVLGPAAEDLETTVDELAGGLAVTVPRGSQVLEFTFTAPSPTFAADAANAIAESYRSQRVDNAEEIVRQATENLSGRIEELGVRLAAVDPAGAEARSLEVQIQTLQERLALVVSNTFYPGSLVSPATTPTDSTKPSLLVFVAAGAFLGLLVGAFAALIRGRARSRSAGTAGAAPDAALEPAPELSPTTSAAATRTAKSPSNATTSHNGQRPARKTDGESAPGTTRSKPVRR